MREIRFRGKRVDSGKWVYGNLIVDKNGGCWIVGEMVEACEEYCNIEFWYKVDPATVGQYVNHKDKHGTEIYEGDILHIKYGSEGGYQKDYSDIVGWNDYFMGFVGVGMGSPYAEPDAFDPDVFCRAEVSGNRWDNPELLEGGKD